MSKINKNNQGVSHEMCGPDLFFNNRIWRVEDVASYLKCSLGHIYNLVNKRKIPCLKKGRLLFFIPSDIQSWILEGDLR